MITIVYISHSDSGEPTCDLTTINEKLTSLQLQPSTCNTTEGIIYILLHDCNLYRHALGA